MSDLNTFIISGNLTRDPESKTVGQGTTMCNICIASNQKVKKGEQWVDNANFFRFTAFGKKAEIYEQYLHKGDKVLVEATVANDVYTKDNIEIKTFKFLVKNIVFASTQSKKKDESPVEDDVPF